MFKYKHHKRIFYEAIALSLLSFTAVILLLIDGSFDILLPVIVGSIGVAALMLAVFTAIYSHLYLRLEIVMDKAEQHFILLRPRRRHYCVYGSASFVAKLRGLLPPTSEISARVCDELCNGLSESPEELAGETFYRYVIRNADEDEQTAEETDEEVVVEEDIWVRIQRVPHGAKQAILITDVTDIYLQKMYLMQSDYFDSASRLLRREAVLSRVQRFIDNGCKMGHYAVLSVNGFEKSAGEIAFDTNKIIHRLGEEYKKLESKRIVAGKNSHNSFLFFFAGTYNDIEERLEGIIRTAKDVIAENNASSRLAVSCGYCDFPEGAGNLDDLVARTEFALYQAISTNARDAVKFSAQKYAALQEGFEKARAVHEVIDNNSVNYYFQPIVNARNGKIFAYEALMRPVSDIKLSPVDIIDVATKDNCLVSIERMTLSNVMRAVEENADRLDGRKIFINTIPNMLLPPEEFETLMERYGDLFKNTVMEITEDGNFNDELFEEFSSRCKRSGSTIALDDFGTGYSNESNLLKFRPAFIKLDRSLITNIHADEQKRTLVEGMVGFAKKHNIKIIAEGVETRQELEYAISIDVDLIQGFYTARPQPVFIEKISKEVADIIVALNLKRAGRSSGKVYETDQPGTIDIVELALSGYSQMIIKHSPVELVGESTRAVEMMINAADDFDGSITMNSCVLFKHPYVFSCGENSRVSLELKGKNKFFGGFNVPTSSELSVTGDGNCEMEIHTTEAVAFGSLSESGYGKLFFGLKGKCHIIMDGEIAIGFGGKYSSVHSQISINGADIELEQKGVHTVAVGSLRGSIAINIIDSAIDITGNGDQVLGVGVALGTVSAELERCEIKGSFSGDTITAVGALDSGNGKIIIDDRSRIETEERAKSIIGIGTRGGSTEISICDSMIDIFAEGNEAVGIGDIEGETTVHVDGSSVVRAAITSGTPKALYSERGKICVDGGNIIFDFDAPVSEAVNSKGEVLEYHKLVSDADIKLDDYDASDSGSYVAPKYEKYPEYVGVYLPESFVADRLDKLGAKTE